VYSVCSPAPIVSVVEATSTNRRFWTAAMKITRMICELAKVVVMKFLRMTLYGYAITATALSVHHIATIAKEVIIKTMCDG
jgi:hypothetical protein